MQISKSVFGEWLSGLRVGITGQVYVEEHLLIQLINKDGNVKLVYDSEDKT